MLTYFYPKLNKSKVVQNVNKYLYSPWYTATIVLLMVMSNLLSLEFVVMWGYLALAIVNTLFAEDGWPIMPMFCCGYMLFSAGNNPAADYGNNDFSTPQGVAQLVTILVIAVICLVARVIFEVVVVKRNNKHNPILATGFLVLGIGYVLSGIFSHYDYIRTLLFALVQIASLCATYFFFFYTVDWSKRKVADGAQLFTIIGLGMFAEVVGMYLKPHVLQRILEGTFERGLLESGWGVYNNVGGMMAMLMPSPFYFASTKARAWRFVLLASILLVGVVLSQSRGAIGAGCLVYIACTVFTFVYSAKAEHKHLTIAFVSIYAVMIATFVSMLVAPNTRSILYSMISQGIKDNDRWNMYSIGLRQFLEAPFFGNGFYGSVGQFGQHGTGVIPEEGYFIPPRYHNTVVQLLASCGIVGFVAYGFHRYQTVKLIVKNPSPHKTILAMGILAHLLASLLDCHMFNLGPGLTYGVMLLLAEMLPNPTQKMATPTLQVECFLQGNV